MLLSRSLGCMRQQGAGICPRERAEIRKANQWFCPACIQADSRPVRCMAMTARPMRPAFLISDRGGSGFLMDRDRFETGRPGTAARSAAWGANHVRRASRRRGAAAGGQPADLGGCPVHGMPHRAERAIIASEWTPDSAVYGAYRGGAWTQEAWTESHWGVTSSTCGWHKRC